MAAYKSGTGFESQPLFHSKFPDKLIIYFVKCYPTVIAVNVYHTSRDLALSILAVVRKRKDHFVTINYHKIGIVIFKPIKCLVIFWAFTHKILF